VHEAREEAARAAEPALAQRAVDEEPEQVQDLRPVREQHRPAVAEAPAQDRDV
jgi:hypothetical protein